MTSTEGAARRGLWHSVLAGAGGPETRWPGWGPCWNRGRQRQDVSGCVGGSVTPGGAGLQATTCAITPLPAHQ